MWCISLEHLNHTGRSACATKPQLRRPPKIRDRIYETVYLAIRAKHLAWRPLVKLAARGAVQRAGWVRRPAAENILNSSPRISLCLRVSVSKVRLSIHDLGIELRKYRPQRGRVAVLDRVDGLNHPKNVRGHDEKVAHTSGARIPVCVRGSLGTNTAAPAPASVTSAPTCTLKNPPARTTPHRRDDGDGVARSGVEGRAGRLHPATRQSQKHRKPNQWYSRSAAGRQSVTSYTE